MRGRCRRLALAAAAVATAPNAVSASFCHIFYVNADTTLEAAQIGDMQEILHIPYDPSFTGMLYMDRNNVETSTTSKAMPYLLDEAGRQTTKEIPTTVWAKMEKRNGANFYEPQYAWRIQKTFKQELDTTSVPTVEEFTTWAAGHCSPEQTKIFTFNMHGGGEKGISGDDSNGHSGLSILELSTIFRKLHNKGINFELIGFDTCLMSAYSNAQALMPYARWLLASLPTEPGYGWNYKKVNTRASSAEQYGKAIIDGFLEQRSGPNELVLTDLAKFADLVPKMQSLMQTMASALNAGDQTFLAAVERARANSANYPAVWETFQSWFHINDGDSGEEASQMDLGSFLSNLGRQCLSLEHQTSELLTLLQRAVVYKHRGVKATCTGPDCEDSWGMGLWYKKRHWVLSAYEYYEKTYHVKRAKLDPLVDSRLEKEIKEALPHWYKFLKANYKFVPKAVKTSLCSSGAAPPSSGPSSSGSECPTNLCTLDAACRCSAGTSQQRAYSEEVGVCYRCTAPAPAPPPVPQRCPADGQTCSKSNACTCSAGMFQKALTAVNGVTCYVCSTGSAPPIASPWQCPVGGSSCSKNRACMCPRGTSKAAFRIRTGLASIEVCYGCLMGHGRAPVPMAPPGAAELHEDLAVLPGDTDIALRGPLTNESFENISDQAPKENEPLAIPVTLPAAACGDEEPLCNMKPSKPTANSDLVIEGSFAPFVTRLEMFVGGLNPRPYPMPPGRRMNDVYDAFFFMKVPSRFVDTTTFKTRWNNVIPYIVSADDECIAFTQIVEQVFAEPSKCSGVHVTLSTPVLYYNSSAAVEANESVRGDLRQIVECSTFSAKQVMSLSIPSASSQNTPRSVDKSEGGFVQPLIKAHKKSTSGKLFNTVACTSKKLFDWSGPLTLEIVKLYDNKARGGVVDKFVGQLVSNKKEVGNTLDDEIADVTRDPFSVTYEIDPMSGLLASAGVESGDFHGTPSGDSSMLNHMGLVLLSALAVVAVVLGAVACWAHRQKPQSRRKTRGVDSRQAKPAPAPAPAPPPALAPAPLMAAYTMPTTAPLMVAPVPTTAYATPTYRPVTTPGQGPFSVAPAMTYAVQPVPVQYAQMQPMQP